MLNDYKASFQQMSIVHYALLAGVLIFCAIVYFIVLPEKGGLDDSTYDIFRFLVPGLAAGAILAGRFVSRQLFSTAEDKADLGDKLAIFRSGMMIRWAMMEGASLFAVVAFMLSGNLVMLLVALAGAAYLFTMRPTPEAAASALGLTETEYRSLID